MSTALTRAGKAHLIIQRSEGDTFSNFAYACNIVFRSIVKAYSSFTYLHFLSSTYLNQESL